MDECGGMHIYLYITGVYISPSGSQVYELIYTTESPLSFFEFFVVRPWSLHRAPEVKPYRHGSRLNTLEYILLTFREHEVLNKALFPGHWIWGTYSDFGVEEPVRTFCGIY